jgi:hypothetical protein
MTTFPERALRCTCAGSALARLAMTVAACERTSAVTDEGRTAILARQVEGDYGRHECRGSKYLA